MSWYEGLLCRTRLEEVLVARFSSLMPLAVSGERRERRTRLLKDIVYYAPKRTCLYLTNVRMISTAVADE